MKAIVFLYSVTESRYPFEKAFGDQSACGRAFAWAAGLSPAVFVAVTAKTEAPVRDAAAACGVTPELVVRDSWTCADLLSAMASACGKEHADAVLLAPLACPFLDGSLTRRLLSDHESYYAEYTFADGYPAGLAPEVIGAGTLGILSQLVAGKPCASLPVGPDCIMSALKTDINSFEVESVLSDTDWRQLRLSFIAESKREFLACRALYDEAARAQSDFSAESLSSLASRSAPVQSTVPAFFSVQITGLSRTAASYNPFIKAYKNQYGSFPVESLGKDALCMPFETFSGLVSQMHGLSEEAVVSLGTYGEPLLHPDFVRCVAEVLSYPGLSVLVETDGTLVDEALCRRLSELSGSDRITWIVSLDAVTSQTYGTIHTCASDAECASLFQAAVSSVSVLSQSFPGRVYPQMVRMNANEHELEAFYRSWHDAGSASGGKVIIQKYDSFCGFLTDERPADLSPLVRVPCWHIKRDMTILYDGSVPLCRERLVQKGGLSAADGLERAWLSITKEVPAHIAGDYSELCRNCDEYYTFNF